MEYLNARTDPFSKVFSASGTELTESAIGNRYTFQGREIDWTTGLAYFRARWYSPETGRWLSKDPKGISGGLNLYAFCSNNPVNFTDPFGLCGTYTFGVGTSVHISLFGVGFTSGWQFTWSQDSDGNTSFGIVGYQGAGITAGSGASLTLDVAGSGNGSISSLDGSSIEIGGSGGAAGVVGGYTYADDGAGGASGLHTGSIGVGTPGAEVHGYAVETTAITF